jgi:thioredoxin-related protein
MDKQTTYSFTAYNASIHFCTHDGEIVINDRAGGEVVVIEGVNQRDLHGAMINYVSNTSLRKDKETFFDFLKEMQKEVTKALQVYEAIQP